MGQRAGEKELQQSSCTDCKWGISNVRGAINQVRGGTKGQTEVLVELLLHIVKDVVVVKFFPSIHLSHHPSMDGIGKKTLAELNNPPSAHVSLSRKGMPSPGLRSFTMVSCMLLSHGSQAVQTSRFSAAKVPMDTCGM
jgi:hypothetical protein